MNTTETPARTDMPALLVGMTQRASDRRAHIEKVSAELARIAAMPNFGRRKPTKPVA